LLFKRDRRLLKIIELLLEIYWGINERIKMNKTQI
jgi:hypothetical protein